MMLAPHPHSTVAELLRLLAVWLAAILLVQGIAAAHALGLGPLHRHGETAAHHEHRHDAAERHHHADADASVLPAGQDPDFNATAFALTAALALMLLGQSRFVSDTRRHVWRAALAWARRMFAPALLLRPPQQS
jgi:hypothetical protein